MPYAIFRRPLSIFSPLTWAVAALASIPLCAEEVTPVADGTKYDLQYKLETGTVLRYTIDHRAAIRSTIDETTQEAQTKTESVKAWKVTDVLPNGEIEFMSVVEQVHMINRLPDRAPVEYDSKKDATPPPGYEDTARALNVPLSVVRMTNRGDIRSRNIKLQQPNADKDAQIVIPLPQEPIAIGATWDEPLDVVVNLESGGTKNVQTRRHFELKGVANGIATIEVDYQVLSPIDAKIESQLVQKLMNGIVRFDVEEGRIASQLYEVDKRVLGFAGPTSSLHYVMRMEEKLSEAKLASSGKLHDRSVLKKQTALASKPAEANSKRVTEGAASPNASKAAATTTPATTTPATTTTTEPPSRNSPPRRPRTATRQSFGKPAYHR